jgi:hypothetical protein
VCWLTPQGNQPNKALFCAFSLIEAKTNTQKKAGPEGPASKAQLSARRRQARKNHFTQETTTWSEPEEVALRFKFRPFPPKLKFFSSPPL